MKFLIKLFSILLILSATFLSACSNKDIVNENIINDNLINAFAKENNISVLQKYFKRNFVLLLYENDSSYGLHLCEAEKDKKGLISKSNYYWDKNDSADVYAKCFSYSYEDDILNTVILLFENKDIQKEAVFAEFKFEDTEFKVALDQKTSAYILEVPNAPKDLVLSNVNLYNSNGEPLTYYRQ
ncbi:MAG: hypothetical protein PWQ93_1023 [Clostridiales bacterium]|nr:hypothetical protein [Clostridiales bacterium]